MTCKTAAAASAALRHAVLWDLYYICVSFVSQDAFAGAVVCLSVLPFTDGNNPENNLLV